MALKSTRWLMAKCLREERNRGKLTFLAARLLDLGLLGSENTTGHVIQACGAVQMFFAAHPGHVTTIKASSPVEPFKLEGELLRDWKAFLRSKSGEYGRKQFGYNYDTLKGYLTKKYGGRRTGGGGGDNEFEIVLRLVAEFLP